MKKHVQALVAVVVGWAGLALADSSPRVMAHYMPWFRAEARPDGSMQWEHWQWYGKGPKHDPDEILENGLRDIASVYYPLIGPYHGRDPAVLEYHCLTAKAAGIEGFIADWYGPDRYEDTVFAGLVGMAERTGMKAAICLEEKSFFPGYSQAQTRAEVLDVAEKQIRHVLNTHATSPAYWRRDGRPVFFMFNNHQDGILGRHILTPEELSDLLGRFREENILLVRGFFDPGLTPLTRSAYLWCDDVKGRGHFYEIGSQLKEKGDLDFWAGMANPGFDDSGVNGWGNGPRVVDRRGTQEYQDTWEEVLQFHPDAVQLVTWNDFGEGTTIEPSVQYGFTFLDLTEKYVSRFTGRAVFLADNSWPLRLYKLRQAASVLPSEKKRSAWEKKLDQFSKDLVAGKRFWMGFRLWWMEKKLGP